MAEKKTWRNFEVVLYPENTSGEVIEQACERLQKWAWCLHDKDPGRVPHIHLMGQPKTPMNTTTICKIFGGIRTNQIENIHGSWADALDYLTHHNAPTKYQYDEKEVHSNFEWKEDAKEARNRVRWDEITNMIASGDIRQYNLTEYVSAVEYVKNKRRIDAAFRWRDSYVKAHLEELIDMKNVVWIYGNTGTGKTSFAKYLAKFNKLVYAITSLGSNMFDEYGDEPCLIVDDLRPEDLTVTELLGLLDPYNFKAAKARYRNKALQTQLVIVTTTKDPRTFWNDIEGSKGENVVQLLRRINTVICVTSTEIIECEYNDEWCLQIGSRYPNAVLAQMKRKETKRITTKALENLATEYVLNNG